MEDPGLSAGLLLFLVFAIFGIIILFAISDRRELDFQIKLFLLAFGLRFAMSLIIYQFGLIELLKDEDGSGWYVGKVWSEQWTNEGVGWLDLPSVLTPAYQQHHKGYYYLLGVLFYITNLPFRLSAAALNCFIGAWTVIICYRTTKTLFTNSIATRVGWWICLYPSLIIWSAQTLKEPIVILLESLVIYSCIAMQQRGSDLRHIATIAISIVLLVPFRFYAAYLASATVILSFVFGSMRIQGKRTQGSFLFSIGVAVAILLMSVFFLGREQQEDLFQQYNLEGIEKYRNGIASSTSSGVQMDSDLKTPGGLVVSLVIGALHFLLAPFPWQLANGSMRMLLVAPEVFLWWWLLYTGVVPGLMSTIRTRFRDVLPLLIIIVGLGLLYSLTFSNIGLIYRQRAQLLPWLLIFYGVGRETVRAGTQVRQRDG